MEEMLRPPRSASSSSADFKDAGTSIEICGIGAFFERGDRPSKPLAAHDPPSGFEDSPLPAGR
jgi:hypothetical protein